MGDYTKCRKCNIEMINDKCPKCGIVAKPLLGVGYDSKSCQVCGGKRERARQIIKNGKDYGWYCYYCWNEFQNKIYHSVPHTYETKEEAAYYAALTKHYLMPLFYGDEPNHEAIQQKADAKRWAFIKLKEEKEEDDIV